jgi:hypothetical protein
MLGPSFESLKTILDPRTEPEEDFLPHDSGNVALNNLWEFSNYQWQFLFPREKVVSERDT